ncbi:MAG: 4-alpha-glucanotransferase [Saprospiraceae bacterium]
MEIHFYLRYHTHSGESCWVSVGDQPPVLLQYGNEEFWQGQLEIAAKSSAPLNYRYHVQKADGSLVTEWETERTLSTESKQAQIQVVDNWNPAGAVENAFLTKPFQTVFLKNPPAQSPKKAAGYTHLFRVKAPLVQGDEVVCLAGHGKALRLWDSSAPLLLQREGHWWTLRLDLSQEDFPLAYKYGVWNTRTNRFLGFENGANRTLYQFPAQQPDLTILHDGFARLPYPNWKGAGVAIPVFSLRSQRSFGIGEFTDLPALVDWGKSVGLKLIQLLPINDTTATHTWTDSYPYAAVSAFALHPIYLNVEAVAGKKHAALWKKLVKKQQELNALEAVDYEDVLQYKWDIIRQLYDLQKADWAKDPAYQAYYAANKHWLAPYGAFCRLRDLNGTPDFSQWSAHSKYLAAEIEQLLTPDSAEFDQIALHLFVQWHLHSQLQAATDYAHANGLIVKGDIPIGIYRYSCDAWVAPELYNMDAQAGAPPDDFAEKGQNWGFPTYNWANMKADGFGWWRQRFEQMNLYFDAFRIDHILGFFRIWSIPLDAVEGILGQFIPAIPVTEQELRTAGVAFDHDRLCRPYITDRLLWETFGDTVVSIIPFLQKRPDGRYDLLPAFASQRQIEAHFASQEPTEQNARLRDGLYGLLSNVILLDRTGAAATSDTAWAGAFRITMEKTRSFQDLDGRTQEQLRRLYLDYFYKRQDDFWQKEALEKLPALKRATKMLICGEDLGMVPHCVPDVMAELGILSLEIQRMPKQADATFFHPKDAPYLSVVTPSTHDMSTLRGWWEEDRALTQRFFNEILQQAGGAPYFCEPWVNKMLLEQHFHSPAMWSIFQLQDLLGMDAALRRENPNDERINVPANPKHYWRYRMHLSLEELQRAEGFNGKLRRMVGESGRG